MIRPRLGHPATTAVRPTTDAEPESSVLEPSRVRSGPHASGTNSSREVVNLR